jgi:hypothetical protein
MRPRTVRYDLPSMHEVGKYIHNEFVEWLKMLKGEILVSGRTTVYLLLTGDTGRTWQNLVNCRRLDSRQYKGIVSGNDGTLD